MFSPEQKATLDAALTLLEDAGREMGPNGAAAAAEAIKAARSIEAARAAGTDVGEEPPEQPPADDAHVAVGATRFSDGEPQTEESLQVAQDA
jgi:hypothetical protein